MSYVMSEALQRSVFARISGDAGVVALVGDAVYDAVPPVPVGDAPELHVTIGEERARDASTKTSIGAVHEFSVTVHARTEGFVRAKAAAAAVCEALLATPLSLDRGSVANLTFLFARADRGPANRPRQVSMRFRALLEDTN